MRKHHFLSSLVIFVAGFALSAIIDGRRLASIATGTQGTLSNAVAPEVAAQTTQKSSTIQKWEYHVVTKYLQRNQADIDFELNRLGEQGFEVCGVAQSGGDLSGLLTITLRRPR
ncbi:MAG TPA: hypothetical protein VFV58_31790 [Blastocatellia bacterium]|nr:hypothetical protein [Blastocatellia bacterium]